MNESEDQFSVVLLADPTRGRACGGCRLCCVLLPVDLPEGHKPANQRCSHLSTSKGCTIYKDRPNPCRQWSCRWLFDANTADLRRPDHAGYVIDAMPDQIRMTDNETGKAVTMPVLQVWCDPTRPDAWRDKPLARYMRLMAARHGMATLIRWSSKDALTIFPPELSDDGHWHEQGGTVSDDVGLFSARRRAG
jgi:hypothetical protein